MLQNTMTEKAQTLLAHVNAFFDPVTLMSIIWMLLGAIVGCILCC